MSLRIKQNANITQGIISNKSSLPSLTTLDRLIVQLPSLPFITTVLSDICSYPP